MLFVIGFVTEYTPEEEEGQLTLEGMEDKQTRAVRIHPHKGYINLTIYLYNYMYLYKYII